MDIPEKEFNDQWNEEAANEKMTPKPLGLNGGVVRGDPSVSMVALCVCVCVCVKRGAWLWLGTS